MKGMPVEWMEDLWSEWKSMEWRVCL